MTVSIKRSEGPGYRMAETIKELNARASGLVDRIAIAIKPELVNCDPMHARAALVSETLRRCGVFQQAPWVVQVWGSMASVTATHL